MDDSHQGRQALSKGDAFVPVMNGQDLPVAPLIRGSSWQASGLQARWLEIHMKRPAAWALPERRILGVAFPAGTTGPKVHIVPISDCRFGLRILAETPQWAIRIRNRWAQTQFILNPPTPVVTRMNTRTFAVS